MNRSLCVDPRTSASEAACLPASPGGAPMTAMPILYRAPDGTAFTSAEAIDAQYDLIATLHEYDEHHDFEQHMASWSERSEAARGRLRCELKIPYGPTRAETLDVFPGEPGGPIVLFLHGGSWSTLTSEEHAFIAPGLVERGATVVVPTYALCPDVTIDEIVRQAKAAVAWTSREGARFGADPNRLAIVGHSAGAHLVARVLETDWEAEYGLPVSTVAGACAISGMFDLRPLPYTAEQPLLRLTAEQVLRNSTILNLPLAAPPLLITNGARQPREYRRQSSDFTAAWTGAGLDGEWWERDDVNHFNELDALAEPGSELTERVLRLADGSL